VSKYKKDGSKLMQIIGTEVLFVFTQKCKTQKAVSLELEIITNLSSARI